MTSNPESNISNKSAMPDVLTSQLHELKAITVTTDEALADVHGTVTKQQLERAPLKFLGEGGEHIVLQPKGHEGLVAKVNKAVLARSLMGGPEQMYGFFENPAAMHEALARENARLAQLRSYFGREHVPNSKRFVLDVPISQALYNSVFSDKHGKTVIESTVPQMVTIQKQIDIPPNSQTKHSFAASYAERSTSDLSLLEKSNKLLIENPQPGISLSEEEFGTLFLVRRNNFGLADIARQATEEPKLKASLTEFIQKTISFTNETGEALDLVGNDNVFFKADKAGNWTYIMPDALAMGEPAFTVAQQALREVSAGQDLSQYQQNRLYNVYNYVRIINWFAEQCGVEQRLKLVPPEIVGKINNYEKLVHYEFQK